MESEHCTVIVQSSPAGNYVTLLDVLIVDHLRTSWTMNTDKLEKHRSSSLTHILQYGVLDFMCMLTVCMCVETVTSIS